MQGRRIWQSAIARVLSKKRSGLPAPDVVAILARELRASTKPSGKADLEAISSAVKLSIQYKPLRVDSLLHEAESGYIAIVNSTTNKVRQRFSIAHEIGHIAIYKTTGLTRAFGHLSPGEQKRGEAAEVEDLCDCFASELLMPMAEWRQHIIEEGVSLGVIKKLMNRYGVSTPAATKRVVDACIWKCAIMIWKAIYEGDELAELKPIYFWTNITLGNHNWPRNIRNSEEFRVPGSPLYALEKRIETIGKIPLPFDSAEGKYLAQSSIVTNQPTQVATLVLAERYGKEILLRSRRLTQQSGIIRKSSST